MEDIGYSIIPFFSRVMNKQWRKEDESYGTDLSNINRGYLYGDKVNCSKSYTNPCRRRKNREEEPMEINRRIFLKGLGGGIAGAVLGSTL
ncbi:MAG TPA: twin-arginine translocation signal domain-containing protein, partial [Thermodesulfobacteriota bacterium]|nr:twin-arginine translocation signal domain-containing protein [Thermodesulfobacteriota bacterium]